MLKVTYGKSVMSRASVFYWYNRISSGNESIEDEERSGRPCTTKLEDNIVFFDSEGIVYRKFVPQGILVNGLFYQNVLDRLCKRIARVRPNLWSDRAFFLLHNNAPAHTVAINTQFLAKKMISVLSHPSYSPDLSPPDYFLFPKLKMELKGNHFGTIEDIQEAVTRKLNTIPKEDFIRTYGKVKRTCQ